MLGGLLALGFVLGLRHALEADHMAAVASLATRSASVRGTVKVAAYWGVGHALALCAFGTIMILLGQALPPAAERILEALVGVTLIALGVDVLRRIRRRKIHFHVHKHEDGVRHVHVHSHAHDHGKAHAASSHQHEHAPRTAARSITIGAVHGLAGTAALVLVALPMQSAPAALLYLVIFGAGTVAGMVLCTAAVSLPFSWSGRRLGKWSRGLEGVLGLVNVGLGLWIIVSSLTTL